MFIVLIDDCSFQLSLNLNYTVLKLMQDQLMGTVK